MNVNNLKTNSHIHILGIAGTMTLPIALDLIQHGHVVTGSDQDHIYPPIGPIIKQHHIPINSTSIDNTIDLAIIGSSFNAFTRCRQEYEQIKSKSIPYISATQYLADVITKKESVLVAGSFGKTTITALLAWVLNQTNHNPSYFFGGLAVNSFPSLVTNTSEWSVIEACESINGLDRQAKFMYYPVKYLVLTSADWEHKESYKTAIDNRQSFIKFIKKLPSDGLLIYNQNNQSAVDLAQYSSAPAIAYNNNHVFDTPLIGQHNQENCAAVFTLCRQLKIDEPAILSAISTFIGIKRRLEIIRKVNNIIFIDDFAQSPSRILQSISAVKTVFPHHQIKVFFEPHASFLQHRTGLQGLGNAFSQATEVIISQIKFNSNPSKITRSTIKDYQLEIGNKLKYLPQYPLIVEHFKNSLSNGDILLHFSSGGLEGLNTFEEIINNYSHINNS